MIEIYSDLDGDRRLFVHGQRGPLARRGRCWPRLGLPSFLVAPRPGCQGRRSSSDSAVLDGRLTGPAACADRHRLLRRRFRSAAPATPGAWCARPACARDWRVRCRRTRGSSCAAARAGASLISLSRASSPESEPEWRISKPWRTRSRPWVPVSAWPSSMSTVATVSGMAARSRGRRVRCAAGSAAPARRCRTLLPSISRTSIPSNARAVIGEHDGPMLLLVDLDGVVYRGAQPVPGVADVLR